MVEVKRLARPTAHGIALAIVVIFTAYAAVQSSITSSQVVAEAEAREALDHRENAIRDAENTCTSSVLFDAIRSLDQRASLSISQAEANAQLQKSQLRFITAIVTRAGEGEEARRLEEYLHELERFVQTVDELAKTAEDFPYPTPSDYAACLAQAKDAGSQASNDE